MIKYTYIQYIFSIILFIILAVPQTDEVKNTHLLMKMLKKINGQREGGGECLTTKKEKQVKIMLATPCC